MLRFVNLKPVQLVAVLVLCGVLLSCGSSSSTTSMSQVIPNISGPWEFIAVSNNGPVTGIEVALAEGQTLVNGLEQPDGQISASSTQIGFVSLDPTTLDATGIGGSCLPLTTANSLGPGSITALGAPIQFTFTENGNVFNVTATLSGDGKSVLNGTYTQQTGNRCTTDTAGTITGTAVSALTGIFAGQMCSPASTTCSTEAVTATVSEHSGQLTLSLLLSETSGSTSFSATGPATGNAFTVTGVFQGQNVTYYGYYEQVNNSPSIYLVNAADPCFANPQATCTTATVLPLQPIG